MSHVQRRVSLTTHMQKFTCRYFMHLRIRLTVIDYYFSSIAGGMQVLSKCVSTAIVMQHPNLVCHPSHRLMDVKEW